MMRETLAAISKKLALLAVPLVALTLTSCVEESMVVVVKKDGSGIVHQRSYQNDAIGNMMFGGLGGGEGEAPQEEAEPDIPSEEELAKVAAKMGEGVTLDSVKASKNKSGWSGYEVIYAFTDINQLKLDMNELSPGDMGADEGSPAAGGEAPEKAPELIAFKMKDGVLEVVVPDPPSSGDMAPSGGGEGGPGAGAGDPFADFDPADPEAAMGLQMMAPMMAGMRMGVFVEPADPVKQTNAKHQKGKMIALMMMDMGKIFQNPQNLAMMSKIENETDRTKLQEVADQIDGLDVDLQEPILIEFE